MNRIKQIQRKFLVFYRINLNYLSQHEDINWSKEGLIYITSWSNIMIKLMSNYIIHFSSGGNQKAPHENYTDFLGHHIDYRECSFHTIKISVLNLVLINFCSNSVSQSVVCHNVLQANSYSTFRTVLFHCLFPIK